MDVEERIDLLNSEQRSRGEVGEKNEALTAHLGRRSRVGGGGGGGGGWCLCVCVCVCVFKEQVSACVADIW